MKSKLFKIILGALILWIGLGIHHVNAEVKMDVDEQGNVTHMLTSTKATSGIRWMTTGFWICPNLTPYGNPVSEINDGKAIKIMLDGEYVKKESIGDDLTGIVTTTYRFSGEYIRDAIQSNKKVNDIFQANAKAAYAAGKEPVLYLESIFASYNANPDGSKTIRKDNLYTKQAIRDAEPWSNKEEWDKDHYNIPIKYGMSSPVYLQLCDSSGDMLEDITVDGVKPSDMTSTGYIRLGDYKVGMEKTFNISKYISVKSGDKPYSMYRTYYAVKKFPDDRRNDRKYTEGGEFSQADIAKVNT